MKILQNKYGLLCCVILSHYYTLITNPIIQTSLSWLEVYQNKFKLYVYQI